MEKWTEIKANKKLRTDKNNEKLYWPNSTTDTAIYALMYHIFYIPFGIKYRKILCAEQFWNGLIFATIWFSLQWLSNERSVIASIRLSIANSICPIKKHSNNNNNNNQNWLVFKYPFVPHIHICKNHTINSILNMKRLIFFFGQIRFLWNRHTSHAYTWQSHEWGKKLVGLLDVFWLCLTTVIEMAKTKTKLKNLPVC